MRELMLHILTIKSMNRNHRGKTVGLVGELDLGERLRRHHSNHHFSLLRGQEMIRGVSFHYI